MLHLPSFILRKVAAVGDAEDVAILLFKGEKGELVEYELNSAAAFPVADWYIMGESGTLTYQNETFRIKYFDPNKLMSLSVNDSLAVKEEPMIIKTAFPGRKRLFLSIKAKR